MADWDDAAGGVDLRGPNTQRPDRGEKTHSEPGDGRDLRMQLNAIKFAICTSQTRQEPDCTLPLILHLVLVLPWSGEE